MDKAGKKGGSMQRRNRKGILNEVRVRIRNMKLRKTRKIKERLGRRGEEKEEKEEVEKKNELDEKEEKEREDKKEEMRIRKRRMGKRRITVLCRVR